MVGALRSCSLEFPVVDKVNFCLTVAAHPEDLASLPFEGFVDSRLKSHGQASSLDQRWTSAREKFLSAFRE